MLTTVEGVYKNGKVILKESPPVKNTSKVLVTFIVDENLKSLTQKRILGSMAGTIDTANDFNDNLDDLEEYI